MKYFTNVKTKKDMVIILFIIIIIATVLILGGYFHGNNKALAREREGLNVTGTIEAKTVTCSFKIPGRVDSLYVLEGHTVEEGQEMAVLEERELDAKLLQAQGSREAAEGQASQANAAIPLTRQQIEAKVKQAQSMVNKAQVGVTNAEQQFNRAKPLLEIGAISQSKLDEAQNAYNAAQQDLFAAQGVLNEATSARLQTKVAEAQYSAASGLYQQAEGAVAEAEAYKDNAVLKAPSSGFITAQYMEQGEMLNSGTPVFEITDLKNTYVKVFIDEKKIGRVKEGQKAEISVDAYPGEVFTATVVWINPAGQFAVKKAIDEQYSHDIRSFGVKIEIPNDELKLKVGMTASVKILEGDK